MLEFEQLTDRDDLEDALYPFLRQLRLESEPDEEAAD